MNVTSICHFQTAASVLTHRLPHEAKPPSRVLPQQGVNMDNILSYPLRPEDLERTAGGLVNLILKNCVRVTGHEISAAKFLED